MGEQSVSQSVSLELIDTTGVLSTSRQVVYMHWCVYLAAAIFPPPVKVICYASVSMSQLLARVYETPSLCVATAACDITMIW